MQDVERKLLKKDRFGDGYSVRIYPWDFVWAAAMGVMFALCLELFYRMAVNYNHKYPSDLYYYAVENPRTHDEKGRFIGELFEFFYNINEGAFLQKSFKSPNAAWSDHIILPLKDFCRNAPSYYLRP